MNPTTIVFLLASFFPCQATKPATDPATTLSRAKLALEMGDLVRAEVLFQEASSAADPAVSSEARRRLAELAPRMGKGPGSPRPGGDSPIAVRVRDAVQKMEREPGLAKEVVEEITWIGAAAVPYLGDWIDDPSISTATRDALVGAAAKIGGESSLALLERLADSPDDLLRRRAMETFVTAFHQGGSVSYSGGRWTAVASRYLGDRDALTRQLALRALQNFPEAIRARLIALAADPDSGVRSTLVQYFFLVLPEAAKETLLADPEARVRRTMAQMLTRREWSDSRPVALRLLRDADPKVRQQALEALPKTSSPGPFDPAAIRAALAPLVADPSVDVRRALAGVAENLVGPAAVPLLLPLLLDEQSSVFEVAMSALERLPRGGLRHEDLPEALEIGPAVVRRHGFRVNSEPSSGRPTIADRYVGFLVTMVGTSGRKGDFAIVARAFAEMPGLAAANNSAAQLLFPVATSEDVPGLCDLYHRVPDSASRSAVLRVLEGKVEGLSGEGAKRAEALLERALAPETDAQVREDALFVALKLQAAALGPAMADALRTLPVQRAWEQVCSSLFAMGKAAPREAAEGIVAFSSRETVYSPQGADLLQHAPYYLAQFPSSVAVPAMTQIFEKAPNPGVRGAVVSNVPERGGAEWTAFLLDVVLASPDAGLRRAGIQRLAYMRAFSPEVAARITAAADDSDGGIRTAVLEYVKAWNSPEAAPIARRLLKDPYSGVRQSACQVLGSLVSQDAVPDLLAALLDENTGVRSAAKAALDQIRFYHEEKKRWEDWHKGRGTDPGEGVRKLLEMLDDPAESIRLAAIESLGTMKAKEALPRLVELVKKGASKAEREAAAKSVERINRE